MEDAHRITEPLTIEEALRSAKQRLVHISLSPYLDALILLEKVMRLSRALILARFSEVLTRDQEQLFFSWVERRKKGYPIAYFQGEKEFFGRLFQVDERVLIPRPETEVLLGKVMEKMKRFSSPFILDVGTGSGILSLSLACELSSLKTHAWVHALDISSYVQDVFEENQRRLVYGAAFLEGDYEKYRAISSQGDHSLAYTFLEERSLERDDPNVFLQKHRERKENRVAFFQSDLFSMCSGKYHIIMANLPYISWEETPDPSIRFEPYGALYGGKKGIETILRLLESASFFLFHGGFLILEIGAGQGFELARRMQEEGFEEIEIFWDDAGLERGIIGKKGRVFEFWGEEQR